MKAPALQSRPHVLLTQDDIRSILRFVTYKPGWVFAVNDLGRGFYLQVWFRAPDTDDLNGPVLDHSGRKWYVSPHATKSEVVQTAFKAILTAEEHETRELFRYRDQPIFGPHFSVDRLAEFATDTFSNTEHRGDPS